MSNTSINLFTLNFDNSPVRTTEINNQIWFLANDVCSILEYKNPRKAIADHCKSKGVTKRYTPALCDVTKRDTTSKARKSQEMTYISEANLFRLIIKSKQEKAVIFEEWVMEELLPTIRKTGSYSLTINTEQQQAIKQAVNEGSYRTGEHHQAIYSKFYQQFKIPRYQDLPASKFDDAIQWLGGVHSRDFRAVNIDNLKRQYNYLVTIQEYYYKVLDLYNNTLAEFLIKNIPHLHHNFSNALNKIQINVSFSLNFIRRELDVCISRQARIEFQ